MAMMGQGLVLMIFGMTIVYLFLWLMIIVIKYAGKFVVRFDYLIPDDAPKPKRKATTAYSVSLKLKYPVFNANETIRSVALSADIPFRFSS